MRKFLKRLKKTIFHKDKKMFLSILTKNDPEKSWNRGKTLDFSPKVCYTESVIFPMISKKKAPQAVK